MPLYETIIIARQDLAPEDVDKLAEKSEKIINDGKGKLISKEYWGLRNFAYKINKFSRGHYLLLNIECDVPTINELNRVIGYDENILRSFTYKTEKHEAKTSLFVSDSAVLAKEAKIKRDERKPSELDLKIESLRIEV